MTIWSNTDGEENVIAGMFEVVPETTGRMTDCTGASVVQRPREGTRPINEDD